MPTKVNWPQAMQRLIANYSQNKHPLEYKNIYQLLVMVVLSAQSTDAIINKIAPALFKAFPNMRALAKALPEDLHPYVKGVRNYVHKAKWLTDAAKLIKTDKNIPLTLEALTALPGVGRKSANVIKREAHAPFEGIVVDLHVVRVAPRLGIAKGDDPKQIEKQLMEILPESEWDAGMAMSFHGREICRPKPKCEICFMRDVCAYYQNLNKQS